jgi:hypothetical protein
MDFLESDIAPNLIRFLKSSYSGRKNRSYYSFLKNAQEEEAPLFNEEQKELIDNLSDLLPIVRVDEYIIVRQLLKKSLDLDELLNYNSKVNKETINHALYILKNKKIINERYELNIHSVTEELKDYVLDLIEYGLSRYEAEFGEYEGIFKIFANYYKEQIAMIMLKDGAMDLRIIGTYYDPNNIGDTYVFIGLKKDEVGKLNYKDKFISPSIFQWESKNNTTVDNAEGKKLINTKRVFLFVRKIEREDGVVLPFTYFGTGKFQNMRVSFTEENGKEYPTLLFDIALDKEVPSMYYLDFEISEGHSEE